MKTTYWCFCLACTLLFSCISNKTSNSFSVKSSNRDTFVNKQRLLLRNYALCKCLLEKFPHDSSLVNDGTLEGYIELSEYGNLAYEAIDSFVKKATLTKYPSKYKKNLYIMKCADIYNSNELDSLIRRLDSEMSQ